MQVSRKIYCAGLALSSAEFGSRSGGAEEALVERRAQHLHSRTFKIAPQAQVRYNSPGQLQLLRPGHDS